MTPGTHISSRCLKCGHRLGITAMADGLERARLLVAAAVADHRALCGGEVAVTEIAAGSFAPSQVRLVGLPLTGTLGKSELEAAASMIVRALQVTGDTWRAVTLDEVLDAVRTDADNGTPPIGPLIGNPFWRPDFAGLVAAGFCSRSGHGSTAKLALTDAAIERLYPWVDGGAAR